MLNRAKYALNSSHSLLAREQSHSGIAVFSCEQGDASEPLVVLEAPGIGIAGMMFRSDHELVAVTQDGMALCWRLEDGEEGVFCGTQLWKLEFRADITCFDAWTDGELPRFVVGDQRGFVLICDLHEAPVWWPGGVLPSWLNLILRDDSIGVVAVLDAFESSL